jgi:RimJ/RimL family protein N-acetyltransferase
MTMMKGGCASAVGSDSLLRGARVRLTGARSSDAETMARWSEEPQYMRMVDSDWMRPRISDDSPLGRAGSSPTGVEFRIRGMADERLLGFLAVHSIEWNNQVGEISIGIGDPADWGKGYGGEAMRLALRYAFHELNLNRVWLTVISYNARAIHLYEKLGFRQEGSMREAVLRDGKRHDMMVMGLLRSEWERSIQPA